MLAESDVALNLDLYLIISTRYYIIALPVDKRMARDYSGDPNGHPIIDTRIFQTTYPTYKLTTFLQEVPYG